MRVVFEVTLILKKLTRLKWGSSITQHNNYELNERKLWPAVAIRMY